MILPSSSAKCTCQERHLQCCDHTIHVRVCNRKKWRHGDWKVKHEEWLKCKTMSDDYEKIMGDMTTRLLESKNCKRNLHDLTYNWCRHSGSIWRTIQHETWKFREVPAWTRVTLIKQDWFGLLGKERWVWTRGFGTYERGTILLKLGWASW